MAYTCNVKGLEEVEKKLSIKKLSEMDVLSSALYFEKLVAEFTLAAGFTLIHNIIFLGKICES